MPHPTDFDAKIEAVKELFNVKIDAQSKIIEGVAKTLDRVVVAIEGQAKHSEALAVLTASHNHLKGNVAAANDACAAKFEHHETRLDTVEKRVEKNTWRIGAALAGVTAVGGAAFSYGVEHLSSIAKFFSGA